MFNYTADLRGLMWLAFFSFVFYAAYVDSKVPIYLILSATRIRQKLYSIVRTIWLHPKSPLFRFKVKLSSDRNARELAKKLNLDKNKDWE